MGGKNSTTSYPKENGTIPQEGEAIEHYDDRNIGRARK